MEVLERLVEPLPQNCMQIVKPKYTFEKRTYEESSFLPESAYPDDESEIYSDTPTDTLSANDEYKEQILEQNESKDTKTET